MYAFNCGANSAVLSISSLARRSVINLRIRARRS
jgi:hypothetical protein